MNGATVILAAGDFPRKGTAARRILEGATRVICCDGAADAYRRKIARDPTLVVGDGDSLRGNFPAVVRFAEQETNDLEKAIRVCRQRGWKRPVILGAMGKREDHAIGNLFRAMAHGLAIVTNGGRFTPVRGACSFRSRKGEPISIFACPGTKMRSTGLEWPLDDVDFVNFHCATLNRATGSRVRIWSSHCAYVWRGEVCGVRGEK